MGWGPWGWGNNTPSGSQLLIRYCLLCFFFQAEDGIRDLTVTGVQTCALPISSFSRLRSCSCEPPLADSRTSSPCSLVVVWVWLPSALTTNEKSILSG